MGFNLAFKVLSTEENLHFMIYVDKSNL